jgi:hypothetical protein
VHANAKLITLGDDFDHSTRIIKQTQKSQSARFYP